MKIIIAGTAWPMRGGIAQFNALLFKYLSAGHEVKIYSFSKQYPEFLFPGKTQYESGSASPFPPGKNNITINSINPINWIINGFRFAGEKADLVIFRFWLPFFAPAYFTIAFIAKLFSKSQILAICDNVIPHEKRFGDRAFTKLFFSQVDKFIIMSKAVEADLLQFNSSKPRKLIPHPVYNIFGEKVFKSEALKFISEDLKLKFNNSDRILLFFGFIRKYKGLEYLIDAMKVLKKENIKLIVAGEFYEEEEKLRNVVLTNELQDNVYFISEYLPDEKIKYLFSVCDLVILPYISATQSGIIQAAYNFDKPVIATDVGGLSEVIVDNKTGYIVQPKSGDEISDAVMKFYNQNKEAEFTENVKEEKMKYTWEEFVRNTEELVKV